MEGKEVIYSNEFLSQVKKLKADMHKLYMDISKEKTPAYDKYGNKIIKQRPDGPDYVEEKYMRTKLDSHFPGWSWEGMFVQFVGGIEYVSVGGHLLIIDEHLIAFGIIPPYRKFFSVGAARIMFKSGMPHTVENLIDVDKNIGAANSNALKRGINRLCRIADDVYKKRAEEEGYDTLEAVITIATPSTAKKVFMDYIADKKLLYSKVLKVLGVGTLDEITDFEEAFRKVKDGL